MAGHHCVQSQVAGPRRRFAVRVCIGGALAAVFAAGGVLLAGAVLAAPGTDGRGALATIAPRSGGLDAAAALASVNRMRGEAHGQALLASSCLDQAAAQTVAVFSSGATPATAPSGCGPVQWGWVAGTDATGAQMLRSAYGATPTGESPLVGKGAARVGFAVGPRRVSGALTGYVLVWVVSA